MNDIIKIIMSSLLCNKISSKKTGIRIRSIEGHERVTKIMLCKELSKTRGATGSSP
jgi:hypothetical protein